MKNPRDPNQQPIHQTEATSREGIQWSPEQRLLIRILMDATKGYIEGNPDDIEWVETEGEVPEDPSYFTFDQVCRYLEVQPEEIRYGICEGVIGEMSLKRVMLLITGKG